MNTSRFLVLICVVPSIACLHANFPLQGATIEEDVRLTPTVAGDHIDFGVDTAIDGKYAGAVSWGFGSVPSAFHLYDRRTGQPLSSLTLAETSNSSRFSAIDISGNRMLVGSQGNAVGSNPTAGAVLLYDISDPYQPQELMQLTAPNTSASSDFGAQIEFRGNQALIGAYGDSPNVSGAAFLYDLSDTNNIQVTKLQPAGGGAPPAYFGITLSMSDETAIVGSFGGKVLLFDLSNGNQLAELESPGPKYTRFGQSVDISGDRAIVWSQQSLPFNRYAGAAHIYDVSDPTSPTYLATLTGSVPLQETGYQGRVAIEGNWAVLSARSSSPAAAYAFNIHDLSNIQELRLRPSGGGFGSEFGISMDIDGSDVVVGAWGQWVGSTRSGAAYIFALPEPSTAWMLLTMMAIATVALRRLR